MKVLNLDDLAPEERVLRLRGNEYKMRPMTVADFIEATREAEKAQKDAEAEQREIPLSETVEKLVDVIIKSFPDCPRSELSSLSVSQLTAILEFMADKKPEEGADEGKK